MNGHPDAVRYSIKLVHPRHLLNGPLFTPGNLADDLPRLMNFSDRQHTTTIVANIQPPHKALVYVTSPIKKFIWAIEYTGTVADGRQIAGNNANLMPNTLQAGWRYNVLPIRFLATIDPDEAPDAEDVLEDAHVVFTPTQSPMQSISQAEYQRIFDVIDWDWVAASVSPGAPV
jgi:hypothetical protein